MENSGYKNFGVLICCASNGVMKVERVKELIDILRKMGYNLLELCLDDMFKIPDEPYFGYLRGGYTGEELREMDAYAKARGIELVPAIQTLAHFKSLVKIPHYSDIVDIDDILLVDEPKTYALIEKMFSTLADCFSSRKVNIGFDEAFKVGMGNYLNKHGYIDRFELLLRHLNRVVKIAEKYGFRIHMWSDMFFRLANRGDYWGKDVQVPENIREKVPEDIELCYWDYYSSDEAQYDHMLEVHEQFRRELWFAGGAWSWCGFAPHNHFFHEDHETGDEAGKEPRHWKRSDHGMGRRRARPAHISPFFLHCTPSGNTRTEIIGTRKSKRDLQSCSGGVLMISCNWICPTVTVKTNITTTIVISGHILGAIGYILAVVCAICGKLPRFRTVRRLLFL